MNWSLEAGVFSFVNEGRDISLVQAQEGLLIFNYDKSESRLSFVSHVRKSNIVAAKLGFPKRNSDRKSKYIRHAPSSCASRLSSHDWVSSARGGFLLDLRSDRKTKFSGPC